MNKQELRKLYRERRNALSVQEREVLNQRIFDQLKTFSWLNYAYVHVYLSIEKFNEPDTIRLIEWIKAYYPSIHIVVSSSDFITGEMKHFILTESTLLAENKWGILEPTEFENEVSEESIDLVLVP